MERGLDIAYPKPDLRIKNGEFVEGRYKTAACKYEAELLALFQYWN